jgi:hypothetical protein
MRKHLRSDESGMALMTVMLVSMLACALMAGLFAAISADQRSLGFDRDQSQAYSAAHAGLEKLTTQLAQLFEADFSPSAAQLSTASAVAPSIYGFNFVGPGGGAGYKVDFTPDPCGSCPNAGNPLPSPSNDITTGPFSGLKGLITPYTLTVTARSTGGGSEVRLRREVQTVAVPVFQFGIFGERSLSFHAGANFDFGGRVHTNANLFLAEGSGATLTFRDKLTAVGEVVRAELENTNSITNSGHTGTVTVPTVVGSTYRNLAANEGSVTAGPGSTKVSGWKNLSEATYNTNVRNTLTGAKALNLPLVSQGAVPIDLIRRPEINSNENIARPPVFAQRYFAMASLRILLSDRASDLTSLPTVTAAQPFALDPALANPFGPAAGMPPLARSIGPVLPGAATVQATGGNGGTGTGTITITGAAFPAWLQMGGTALPTFIIGGSTVTNCTAMTATQIQNCTVAGATTPLNTNFNVAFPTGEVRTFRTAGSGSATVGGGKNITLVSTNSLAWATPPRNLWFTTGRSPVTCSGYNAAAGTRQLTGCYWQTAPPNGSAITTNALSNAGESLLGGYIKIERQDAVGGAWTDVTADILNLGFSAPNQEGLICADPTPNAVIRLQRLRDNGANAPCLHAGSLVATDYWPNVLYDTREGSYRDVNTTAPMAMGGVINYVALDIRNLGRWFRGEIGAMGAQALRNNGIIVYFSDRRGNHDWDDPNDRETGEYGNEDSVNSAGGAGPADPVPNGGMPEGGEDRNEDGDLDTYGARVETTVAGVVPAGAPIAANMPFGTGATPRTTITNPGEARVNRQIFFRHALKLINGGIGGGVNNVSMTLNPADQNAGLAIASENGVYVQGNYNATSTDANANPSVPASIIADAIAILSNNWSDVKSLTDPNDMAARDATDTGYRFAMVAGKSVAFAKPAWAAAGDWGTDGGVHNFMRMLEDWGGFTIFYRGSMVSLYTARQLIGIYKANGNTYAPGTRAFSFDTNFLNPFLLPPGTPMFRDVNTLRFRQILRPNQ